MFCGGGVGLFARPPPLKTALHILRFERVGAATKIDSFGSDRRRPRWELNLFLLPKRPKIGRLRSD